MRSSARWIAALTALTAVSTLSVAAEPSTLSANFPDLPAQDQGSIPDVPEGSASLRGRVVADADAANVAGVPVVLYAISPDGTPGLRGALTDAAGAFAFEAITNDPATVYLLGARYSNIPFGTRFSFEAGELERSIDLAVAETIADVRAAEVGEVRIELVENCENLTVIESHRLENPTTDYLFIPEAERSERRPILEIALPGGAYRVRSNLGDGLEQSGDMLSFWGPLRPGGHEVEFSYEIPARSVSFGLRRNFPSGARRLVLVNRLRGPQIERATDGEVDPGDTVVIDVERAPSIESGARISALEARFRLELDGAALSVEQQHTLSVEGNGPLSAGSGPPIFCLALPEGADDLRFAEEALAMGLSRDPSGALAIRGPVPIGQSDLTLRFLLPVERDDPLFSQTLPFDVPLLTMLVADTGVVVESTRLHRRRPVRRPDRNFLHLEAFEIPAGEPIELGLQPIEARTSLPRPATAGLAAAAAALAIGFLIAPLRRANHETRETPSAATTAAEQRDAVLDAIRGLDEDFEIGKVTASDHREMRQVLRAEAVALLRAERAARAQSAIVEPAPTGCPHCETEVGPEARFCSQCGAQLDRPESGDEAASV